METPKVGMGQAGALKAEDESNVEEGDPVRGPAQKRKSGMGIKSHCIRQSQEDVREMLRVVVGDHPVKMTIRIEEGGVKIQRAVNAQKKTGNRDEEYAIGNGRVEEKEKVAAKDKWQNKDKRKEFETCRESEKRGGECAAVAFEKNKHSQNGYRCKDTYLSPFEIVQEGKGSQREGNEEKLDRQSGWDELAEGEQVENDEDDLQNSPEGKRSVESQRREYGKQNGDERRIYKAFDR